MFSIPYKLIPLFIIFNMRLTNQCCPFPYSTNLTARMIFQIKNLNISKLHFFDRLANFKLTKSQTSLYFLSIKLMAKNHKRQCQFLFSLSIEAYIIMGPNFMNLQARSISRRSLHFMVLTTILMTRCQVSIMITSSTTSSVFTHKIYFRSSATTRSSLAKTR